jgi:hypothetical protein
MLYHFGDIHTGLKKMFPNADWSYLDSRKRELSEKAKESMENQELFDLIDQGVDVYAMEEEKERARQEAEQKRLDEERKRVADAKAAELLAPQQPALLMIGWYENTGNDQHHQ